MENVKDIMELLMNQAVLHGEDNRQPIIYSMLNYPELGISLAPVRGTGVSWVATIFVKQTDEVENKE